jgi:predicted ester cyclase
MSTEKNKATLRRYYDEVFNKKNLSVWDELMDKNYTMSPVGNRTGGLKGLEGAKQVATGISGNAPDTKITIDEMVADGDTVAVRGAFKGTNTGNLQDNPPTGKKFVRAFAAFYRFKDGKIAEGWTVQDTLGMYQQLGLTPPK